MIVVLPRICAYRVRHMTLSGQVTPRCCSGNLRAAQSLHTGCTRPHGSEHVHDVRHALLRARPLNRAQRERSDKAVLLLGLREAENNDKPLTLRRSESKMGDRGEDWLLT